MKICVFSFNDADEWVGLFLHRYTHAHAHLMSLCVGMCEQKRDQTMGAAGYRENVKYTSFSPFSWTSDSYFLPH